MAWVAVVVLVVAGLRDHARREELPRVGAPMMPAISLGAGQEISLAPEPGIDLVVEVRVELAADDCEWTNGNDRFFF